MNDVVRKNGIILDVGSKFKQFFKLMSRRAAPG